MIPILTKLAAASPFHNRFVSPGSKRAFLRAFRTMLTNGVSPIRKCRTVTAVTWVREISTLVSLFAEITVKECGRDARATAGLPPQQAKTGLAGGPGLETGAT